MYALPYIHKFGPETVQTPDDFSANKGLSFRSPMGAHGIWAAQVPFLPALDAEELKGGGAGRINKVVWRQLRFLYDLARVESNRATLELRFVAQPAENENELGRVNIFFFGKVFSNSQSQVEPTGLQLWQKFVSAYPLEDPFNYPLQPITDEQEFLESFHPLPESELQQIGSIIEIRRFEDMPEWVGSSLLGDTPASFGDYIVHPFVPSLDFSAMGRLFEVLAVQRQTCFASISLRAVRLFDSEMMLVNEMAARFREDTKESSETISEFARSRARMGARIYGALMQEREFLLQVKVHVVGNPAPYTLIEALGSEMMNNGRNQFPTKWVSVTPSSENEQSVAMHNVQRLEQEDWGKSIAHPSLQRLRGIIDVQQAAGAFRLPIPPESGFLPGVLVRSEPFVSPQDHLENDHASIGEDDSSISLGKIVHRGRPTNRNFTVPLNHLTRHSLIGGSTGSGKSTTILSLLAQLWRRSTPIPFLVLYPIDKPDYRALLNLPHLKDDLLIFTLGDETVAPFRFNPFHAPDGVLLKTHISRLMRAFNAAFDLFPPLPMIYRRALRLIYEEKGWNIISDRGNVTRPYPMMTDFYRAIEAITDNLGYEGEVYDNIRQASVIRIADLLENAGSVLNVQKSPSFKLLMDRPVVMELGRIGSQEDISLIMGFLLILLTESLEKNSRPHPHLTVVEEAHRLMPAGSVLDRGNSGAQTGEDFGNILAEIRGFNAGLIIAEQMPTRLVPGAIGNTYLKIMHWQEDRESFELFADIMNLSDAQRSYARRLKAGEAIVRNRFGRPVHILVDNVSELLDNPTFSDEFIHEQMLQKPERYGLYMSEPDIVSVWETSRPSVELDTSSVIFHSPMGRECAFCQSLLQTGRCLHRKDALRLLRSEQGQRIAQQLYQSLTQQNLDQTELPAAFAYQLTELSDQSLDPSGVGYCGLAHIARELLEETEEINDTVRKAYNSLERYPWSIFKDSVKREDRLGKQ